MSKEWLVDGLMGAGEFSVFYGEPGANKSTLVGDIGLHVASGLPWHGRQVRQGAVLYLALEREPFVSRCARAFTLKHGFVDIPYAIAKGPVDFLKPQAADAIVEMVARVQNRTGHPVMLIVVDTLSRSLCGADENSAKDMGTFITTISRIQEGTRAHLLVVHHPPLDAKDRIRGHGALLGAADLAVHIAKKGLLRTATVKKANDGDHGQRFCFALESVPIDATSTGLVTLPIRDEAGGDIERRPVRKLSDRNRRAHDVIGLCMHKKGRPAPDDLGLPKAARVVELDFWREELFAAGVIDRDAPNPRTDFQRIRHALASRKVIGERNGLVWLV